MQFRDINAQYEAMKPDIDRAIAQAVSSGRYIQGPQVTELELRLAECVGVKHCITCANGTDALQLALMAWGVGEGDAVFIPDFTFFASGEAPALLGATPFFIDVNESTFNICPDSLECAINFVESNTDLRPRVVVSVDLFGLPADYGQIQEICKRHNLLLLEDGAQGFGGSIDKTKACSFGDISTTSFFPAKPLGCYGDGGALFTNNDEWASLLRSLAFHGKGSTKYDNIRIGINSRLDTIQAAVLLVKLDAYENHEYTRVNEVASQYGSEISNSLFILPTVPVGYSSAWAQYTVRVVGFDRATVQDFLKMQGVPTMVYYPRPMHKQEAFVQNFSDFGSFLVTDDLCESVLSLPIGPYMKDDDVLKVIAALNSLQKKNRAI